MRPVPDSQEVFMHSISNQSIIFDLLELTEIPDDEAAEYAFLTLQESFNHNFIFNNLRFHFNEISEGKEAQILFQKKLPVTLL